RSLPEGPPAVRGFSVFYQERHSSVALPPCLTRLQFKPCAIPRILRIMVFGKSFQFTTESRIPLITQIRETVMKSLRLTLAIASLSAMVWAPAQAQDVQERTIKFGHLNNTD